MFFTTTRGHYDNNTIYKHTIRFWNKLLLEGGCDDIPRIASLKVLPAHQQTADDFVSTLRSEQYDVSVANGYFKHHDDSFYSGYLGDIIRMASYAQKYRHCQYWLWLEDDWILDGNAMGVPSPGWTICKLLSSAVSLMEQLPNLACVRFLSERANLIQSSPTENIYYIKDNYCGFPTFTFQPSIVRSRDLFVVSNLLRTPIIHSLRHLHIELLFTAIMNMVCGPDAAYGCFDYDLARALHIGVQGFASDKFPQLSN